MQPNRSDQREDPRQSVPQTGAVERVSAILEALRRADGGLGVSELSRRTGISKSSVHRLVQDMSAHRLLENAGQTYQLGLRLFELGQQVPRQRDLREAAKPYMNDLREATGYSVHLAVLDGDSVVYLDVLRSPAAPPLPIQMGGRWPAHGTGIGKAILAYSSDGIVNDILAGGLARISRRTIDTPGRFIKELSRIRERGVSFDLEESRAGVVCAAAPVFDTNGGVVGGLSVSGWHNKINLDQAAAAVRTAALALSRELGRAS